MNTCLLLLAVTLSAPAPGQSDLVTRTQQDKLLIFAGRLDGEHGGSGTILVFRPFGDRLSLQVDLAPEAKGRPDYYSDAAKLGEALKRIEETYTAQRAPQIPQVSTSQNTLCFREGKREGPCVVYSVKRVDGMGKLFLELTCGSILEDSCTIQGITAELVRP